MKKAETFKGSPRNFKLVHQYLCITSIDFKRKCLFGVVEFCILPLQSNLTKLKLNCKQLRIFRVCVQDNKENSEWFDAGFQLDDAEQNVCSQSKKRSLEHFASCLQNAISSVEPENGGGELTVKLPKEAQRFVSEKKTFRLSIEFSLEHPEGGIQFVIPSGNGTMTERSAHMFTYGHGNSSRLWFPCVDSYSEVCTWKIDVTVDKDMTAVSCGDLVEQVYTSDEKHKTFSYVLDIPTAAPNIALAVGPFEIHVDPVMPEVTHFCLPGLLPLLKHATGFLNEVFEFYEESLSCHYPYPNYKQVFVDNAYKDASSYATLAIYSTNLLHSSRIIDQTFMTRKTLSLTLAQQFFGCYLSKHTWSDAWLQAGITIYLYGLYVKKAFGNNEYRDWIREEMKNVCQYETEGPGLSPLHNKRSSDTTVADNTSSTGSETPGVPFSQPSFLHMHPHFTSCKQLEAATSKAHLVMRLIEMRIGQEPLLQVFNKLLSLAKTAVKSKFDLSSWGNMLLSTTGFLRSISIVSGKDLNVFVDQWLYRSGVVSFSGNFVFNRKRNIVELDLKQNLKRGTFKYMGPLTVCIQELDGSFKHTVQIEDSLSHHELQCHSKSRRNKRKKIPLMTGEEVDIDLDTMDSDSPVLWIRVDPEVNLIRKVSFEQPDFMWHFQLRHERDVIAQAEAIENLRSFPTRQTMAAYIDIAKQKECFYKVRLQAIERLAKLGNVSGESWNIHLTMISMFQDFFGSQACPTIVRYNNFSDFIDYFVQKALVSCIGFCRDVHAQCPKAVVQFLLDLLKYNDNRLNKYSDSYYVSAIINGLMNTVTATVPLISTDSEGKQTVKLSEECKVLLSEITKHLNLEKLLPSYKYVVTRSCLKGLRLLQTNGHIPSDSDIFKYYARHGHFEDVRQTAIECLVDFVKAESSSDILELLLSMADQDPSPNIRHCILRTMTENPPFTRKSDSTLNNLALVEKLWNYASKWWADARLRCDVMDLYNALWGRVTPGCVPAQGMGILIDLKEKRITNLSPLPPAQNPSNLESSHSDEESGASKEKKTKKTHSLSPSSENITDSQPPTPMSVGSHSSSGHKLKLKIKLAEEEGGNDSGGEAHTKTVREPTNSERDKKKHKKKKKKKHKEEHRRQLSNSGGSPLTNESASNHSLVSQ